MGQVVIVGSYTGTTGDRSLYNQRYDPDESQLPLVRRSLNRLGLRHWSGVTPPRYDPAQIDVTRERARRPGPGHIGTVWVISFFIFFVWGRRTFESITSEKRYRRISVPPGPHMTHPRHGGVVNWYSDPHPRPYFQVFQDLHCRCGGVYVGLVEVFPKLWILAPGPRLDSPDFHVCPLRFFGPVYGLIRFPNPCRFDCILHCRFGNHGPDSCCVDYRAHSEFLVCDSASI